MNPAPIQLSSCYTQLDLGRLAEEADAVVEGQVVDSSRAFQLRPRAELQPSLPDGFNLVFTLHWFFPSNVLKPRDAMPPLPGALLPVVTLGGVSDNLSASVDGEASLFRGEIVALFLTSAPTAFNWQADLQQLSGPGARSIPPWMHPLSVLGGEQGKYTFGPGGESLNRAGLREPLPLATFRALFR